MSEVDDAIASARASWARISEGAPDARARPRRQRRRTATLGTRLALIGAANAVLLVAAIVIGAALIPLGIFGALAVMALMIVVTLLIAFAPAARPLPAAKLREADLRALPAQTERWLQGQRAALPPPAQHLLDRIGDRLDTLSPQLGAVEPNGELAGEIRRLIGDQLPAFVADYARVPEPLRRVERNGRTPDAALADGLGVIEREIAGFTTRIAQTDLDSLQTRGRYLETRYSGDESS